MGRENSETAAEQQNRAKPYGIPATCAESQKKTVVSFALDAKICDGERGHVARVFIERDSEGFNSRCGSKIPPGLVESGMDCIGQCKSQIFTGHESASRETGEQVDLTDEERGNQKPSTDHNDNTLASRNPQHSQRCDLKFDLINESGTIERKTRKSSESKSEVYSNVCENENFVSSPNVDRSTQDLRFVIGGTVDSISASFSLSFKTDSSSLVSSTALGGCTDGLPVTRADVSDQFLHPVAEHPVATSGGRLCNESSLTVSSNETTSCVAVDSQLSRQSTEASEPSIPDSNTESSVNTSEMSSDNPHRKVMSRSRRKNLVDCCKRRSLRRRSPRLPSIPDESSSEQLMHMSPSFINVPADFYLPDDDFAQLKLGKLKREGVLSLGSCPFVRTSKTVGGSSIGEKVVVAELDSKSSFSSRRGKHRRRTSSSDPGQMLHSGSRRPTETEDRLRHFDSEDLKLAAATGVNEMVVAEQRQQNEEQQQQQVKLLRQCSQEPRQRQHRTEESQHAPQHRKEEGQLQNMMGGKSGHLQKLTDTGKKLVSIFSFLSSVFVVLDQYLTLIH